MPGNGSKWMPYTLPWNDAPLAGEYCLGDTIIVDVNEDKGGLAFRPAQEPELVAEM